MPHELMMCVATIDHLLNQPHDNRIKAMPGQNITLLDEQQKQEMTFTLVPPEDSDPDNGKLSFLSPLGSKLLGNSPGNYVEVNIFGRQNRFYITRIDPL